MTLLSVYVTVYVIVGILIADSGYRRRTKPVDEKRYAVAIVYFLFTFFWPVVVASAIYVIARRMRRHP